MRFAVLGTLTAEGPGGPVELGAPKQRAVLALLLLSANRVVSVDRIIDDLWSGGPPPGALGAVHAYVSVLRRILEPDRAPRAQSSVLVSMAPGYMLRVAPADLDVLRFEELVAIAWPMIDDDPLAAIAQLEAALALWRGPLLAEFAHETWVRDVAVRLDERRASALETRLQLLVSLGGSVDVVSDLEAAVQMYPLREGLWALLMLTQYRLGRQADALRSFQRVRELLGSGLGLEPGVELQALERRIVEQDPSLVDPTIGPPTRSPAARRIDQQHDLADTVGFTGRVDQLREIGAYLDALHDGRGGAVVVTGAPGVGKTRLVEVALSGRHDLTVVWGRCVEGDTSPPLWPWLQVAAALQGAGASLAAAVQPSGARGGGRTFSSRAELLGAAVEAVLGAATTPLVIVIDDAQWADVTSHQLVQLLLARVSAAALLLVLTVRDRDHANDEVRATLAATARHRSATRIGLDGLDPGAVASYVLARFGTAPSTAAANLLFERTGGNPFYLTEILRGVPSAQALEDPTVVARLLPTSIREIVGRRVDRLPDDVAVFLTAASVLGRDFDWRVVKAIVGADTETCLDAIDIAVINGFVEEGRSATRLQFCHDLVRESLYEQASSIGRARLHSRALTELDGHYVTRAGHENELASHAWLARPVIDAETATALQLDAAIAAIDSLAFEQADQLLGRMVELSDSLDAARRADVLLDSLHRKARLSRMVRGGESAITVAAFEVVRDLLAIAGVSATTLRVLADLADDDMIRGDLRGAVARSRQLIEVAHELGDTFAESVGRFKLATAFWFVGDVAATVDELRVSLDLGRDWQRGRRISELGMHPRPIALSFYSLALRTFGEDEMASAAADEAASLSLRVGKPVNEAMVAIFAAMEAVVTRRPDEALRHTEHYMAIAGALGMTLLNYQADLTSGWALGVGGDVEGALVRVRRTRASLAAVSSHPLVISSAFVEADVLLHNGQPAAALEIICQATEGRELNFEGLLLPELLRVRGLALDALGDRARAIEALHHAMEVGRSQAAHLFVDRALTALRSLDAP